MTRVRIPQPDIEEDVSAEQVVAYLLARGWTEMTALSSPSFVEFELRPRDADQNDGACGVPREGNKRMSANIAEAIHDIARAEQRHPSDVFADIVGPTRAASVGRECGEDGRGLCGFRRADMTECSAARGAGESEEQKR